MPNVPNLGNLNVGSKSQSSNAQGGLADQLDGGAIQDELGRSRMLSSQLDIAGASQPRSTLDVLTSPRGIATLIAGLGGIAAGGGARAAGIGALLGALQGAQQTQEGERAQKDAAIDQLSKQFEQSQNRLLKMQTNLAGLFNTNPDAFVDPETGEHIDPAILGRLITGENISLDPTSRRELAMRGEDHKQKTALWMNVIKLATDPGSSKLAVERLLQHLTPDGRLPDPQVVEAISQTFRDSAGDELGLREIFLKDFGVSGIDAYIFARQNGLSLSDPQVIGMLQTPAGNAQQVMDNRSIAILDDLIAFEKDPANREEILAIYKLGKSTRETQEAINQLYLASIVGDESRTITEMNMANKLLGVNGLSDRNLEWFGGYKGVIEKSEMQRLIDAKLHERLGTSPEEIRATAIKAGDQRQADLENAQRTNSGTWYMGRLSEIELSLREGMRPLGIVPTDSTLAIARKFILKNAFAKMGINRSDVGSLSADDKRKLDKIISAETQRVIKNQK